MALQDGDTVRVHYTGRLDDGTVFDSSLEGEPLTFTIGAGHVIKGFEDAVRGHELGDAVNAIIPPEAAYGDSDPELVRELPREQVQGDLAPGQYIEMTAEEDGAVLRATVIRLDDQTIVLDFNHFLAGKTLAFDLTIVGVEEGAGAGDAPAGAPAA